MEVFMLTTGLSHPSSLIMSRSSSLSLIPVLAKVNNVINCSGHHRGSNSILPKEKKAPSAVSSRK